MTALLYPNILPSPGLTQSRWKSWHVDTNSRFCSRIQRSQRRSPELLSAAPEEGPNSGVLVVVDDDSAAKCCFGLLPCGPLDLPFPQNRLLNVHYQAGQMALCDDVYLIPVINQPLSSNLYYAIKPHRKHKGEAFTSSGNEDRRTCFFFFTKDAKPRPLDPNDVYQQFKIHQYHHCCPYNPFIGCTRFTARSIASDGYAPRFLRRCGWNMFSKKAKNVALGEASGLDSSLRARLPDFAFPLSQEVSEPPSVVGKWYCPFMFVKDGEISDQVKKSMFYEVTLEQRWEQVFTCEYKGKNNVVVDVVVPMKVVRVGEKEAVEEERNGLVWFKTGGEKEEAGGFGLSSLVVERMVWEEKRAGWVEKAEQGRVLRTEEYGGSTGWRRFGCYVVVEKFVVKRMDGSVVLTYDFKHTHKIKTKWE